MQKYYGWGLPVNISTHGAGIDRLIYLMHILMFVLFIGWGIFFVYALIRFRQKDGHKAHYHTKHFKIPTYLEAAVAISELLLLTAFAMPIWHHLKTDFPAGADAVKIRVVAQQFAWNVHYPGKDGVFGKVDPKFMDSSNPLGLDPGDPAGKDDVATINQLHIPVNTPVSVQLTSKDVIHCFNLPVMRIKQDAIPGMMIPVWFEANQTGDFEIACAQLCGLGHYRMRGFFIVESKDKFQAWLAEQAPQTAPPAATASQGGQVS